MTQEQWTTMADLVAARERFEAAIPGWQVPAVQGLGLVRSGAAGEPDAVEFPVVNGGAPSLPAVVLAGVVGRAGQTATYDVSREQLRRAVEILSPAAAATFMPHPNLAAWNAIAAALDADPAARAVAVYVADLTDPVTSPYDAALRAQAAGR